MKTFYELMDIDSANVVGFFPTEEEALATVRAAYERHGAAGVEGLALSENPADGPARLIAEGEELARLAMEARGKPIGAGVEGQ